MLFRSLVIVVRSSCRVPFFHFSNHFNLVFHQSINGGDMRARLRNSEINGNLYENHLFVAHEMTIIMEADEIAWDVRSIACTFLNYVSG